MPPTSDFFCCADTRRNWNITWMLSILNEFLLDVKESGIDYDQTVFALVMDFLRTRAAEGMPAKELCHLMYRLALSSERYFDEPWHTMYYMEDLHDEAEMDIYVSKGDFCRKFHAFLSVRLSFPSGKGLCFHRDSEAVPL